MLVSTYKLIFHWLADITEFLLQANMFFIIQFLPETNFQDPKKSF